MKNIIFYIGVVLCIIAGVLVSAKQNADSRLLEKQRADSLAALDKLEYQTIIQREQILRSRTGLARNYDTLAEAVYLSEAALADLEKQLEGNATTERKLANLRSALVTQIDATESFKRHNSVLRNSERYLPLLGRQLAPAVAQAGYIQAAHSLTKIVEEAQEYVKVSGLINANQLIAHQDELDLILGYLPSYMEQQSLEFGAHFATLIEVKRSADSYMNQALNSRVLDIAESLRADMQFSDTHGAAESNIATYASPTIAILALVLLTAWLALSIIGERRQGNRTGELKTTAKAHINSSQDMMDHIENHISGFGDTLKISDKVSAMLKELESSIRTKDREKTNRLIGSLIKAQKLFKGNQFENNKGALQDLRGHLRESKHTLQALEHTIQQQ